MTSFTEAVNSISSDRYQLVAGDEYHDPDKADTREGPFSEFDALQEYYRSRSQLARALNWSRDTIRAWERRTVKHPRREHQQQVHELLLLCHRVRPWVSDKLAAGEWTMAENPGLEGLVPAAIISRLGATGAEKLKSVFAQIAPTAEKKMEEPSDQEMLMILDRVAASILTDIDDDAGNMLS